MASSVDIVNSTLKRDDIVPFLVEVSIADDMFLRVKESLTRIGIPGMHTDKPTLNQTCHILSKKGRYYICHFKTMFVLDGKENTLTEADIARQNLIIKLLQDWSLVKVIDPKMIESPMCSLKTIKIVKYQDRDQWSFVNRYNIGGVKPRKIE